VCHGIKLRETPGASYQDLPFYLECLFHLNKVYAVNEPLINYRTSNPTSSSAKGSNKGFLLFDLMSYVEKQMELKNPPKYKRYKNLIASSLFFHHYWHYDRLLPELRDQFLLKLQEAMREYARRGMNPVYLSSIHQEDCQALLKGGPVRYRRTLMLRNERHRIAPVLEFLRREIYNPFVLPFRLLGRSIVNIFRSVIIEK